MLIRVTHKFARLGIETLTHWKGIPERYGVEPSNSTVLIVGVLLYRHYASSSGRTNASHLLHGQ
jgi:hypothetical protein